MLFLLLSALAPATPAVAPWITSDATLVVLTGLPGDVQSETAFDDQRGRLLEALASPEVAPRRVFLLSDSPPRVPPARALGAELRPGSREAFLALSRDVAKEGGPLVVVVLGHAGMQGATPVFHVRGLRLTPDDFATFASACGTRPSRWVLYFRGSGAFASRLRAPDRALLTSDAATPLPGDPVGFSLFVEAVRSKPDLDFEGLARRVGGDTVSWYAEHKLARAEEPTLWTREAATPLAVGTSALAERTPETKAAALGPAWEGIARVDKARFPDDAACILRRTTRHTIGEDPALAEEEDVFYQILTEDGISSGDVELPYAPPDEKLALLDAEILREDGRLERIDASSIRDAGGSSGFPDYPGPSVKLFSFPGVHPGAILRLHTRRSWQAFPLPAVVEAVPLGSSLPTLETRIEVTLPVEKELHYAFQGIPSLAPRVESASYGHTYSWRVGEVRGESDEPLVPPERHPRLLLSAFADWGAFEHWYERLIDLADEETPELVAQAAALAKGKTTPLEKVRAIYEFVTRMRYVAVPLGVNSLRPHAAANVLKNRYGDCKDKANLFNTLLRSQGIPASLVLVPRFSDAYDAVPGIGFNHAISRVKVGDEWIWADTTDPVARFGLLPPGDPGRHVLVIGGGKLEQLPAPDPGAHRLTLSAKVPLSSEPARIEVTTRGFVDYALRLAAEGASRRSILGSAYHPTAGTFAQARQAHSSPADLASEFSLTTSGRFAGLVSHVGESDLVRAPFWIPDEWESALDARTAPLFLNEGYPLALEERVEIGLPPGAGAVRLPPAEESTAPPLLYRVEWTQGPSGPVASLHAELQAGDLGPGETTSFQEQLRGLLGALAQGLAYAPARERRP
jgi:transglutaminase-like putative cysteine protease